MDELALLRAKRHAEWLASKGSPPAPKPVAPPPAPVVDLTDDARPPKQRRFLLPSSTSTPSGTLVSLLDDEEHDDGAQGVPRALAPAHASARCRILRLRHPKTGAASPIVLLRDPFNDAGRAMARDVGVLAASPPPGWAAGPHQQKTPSKEAASSLGAVLFDPDKGGASVHSLLDAAFPQGGFSYQFTGVAGTPSGFLPVNAGVLTQLGASLLGTAARAVEEADKGFSGKAAAAELRAPAPWMQPTGLVYPSRGWLQDHFDGVGRLLVLISLGDTVRFTAGNDVVTFRSGDVLIFNGGPAHGVMHGVRTVVENTCPPSLKQFMGNVSRASIQIRQQ